MGRLVVAMMVSVDGYIAGPEGQDGDWVQIDEALHRHVNDLARGASALLYGRKVFDVMIPYWPDAADDPERPGYEQDFGRIFVEKPKVVFSRTLEETRWNTRVVRDGIAEEVARLRNDTPGYLLSFGGSEVVSTLHEHGLVDEIDLFVQPSALGGGTPFFRRPWNLELVESRAFDVGAVLLRYAVR